MMATAKKVSSTLPLFISLLFISCIADPWPEPDSAKYEDDGAETPAGNDPDDTNGTVGGDGDTDTGGDYKPPGKDISTDDQTPTDAGPNDESDAGLLIRDRIFIDTPMDAGVATVVGLPGAVSANGTLVVRGNDMAQIVVVGREGGFADRVSTGVFGQKLELLFIDEDEGVDSLLLEVGDDKTAFAGGILGEGDGAYRLTDSMVTIHGAGAHLASHTVVVAGNLTGDVGAVAPIVCRDDDCAFSMIIPAESGDEVALFLAGGGGDAFSGAGQAGTTSDIIIID